MTAPWVAAAIGAAGLSLTALVYAVSLSFRVGENARDMEMVKRMLGLSNGTDAVFVRADIAEARYEALLARIDVLRERMDEIKAALGPKKEP